MWSKQAGFSYYLYYFFSLFFLISAYFLINYDPVLAYADLAGAAFLILFAEWKRKKRVKIKE